MNYLIHLLFIIMAGVPVVKGVKAMNKCSTKGVWVEKTPVSNSVTYTWRLGTKNPDDKHGKKNADIHSTGFSTEEKALGYASLFRWYYHD